MMKSPRKRTSTESPNVANTKKNKNESMVNGVPETMQASDIHTRCIDTLRCLGAEMPYIAKSGHPGAPMGCAPIAHVLWGSYMRYNPKDVNWMNRDRFVLSNGHACALLYTMLHLTGYDLSLDDLKQFRQLHSKTPGHPECFVTSGVEVCTGPLGQGIANGVGMALTSQHLAAVYNKPDFEIFNNFIYVLCGDGCLQEGVALEAISFAGHHKLGHLILIFDDNKITIDGSTDLTISEDIDTKMRSCGWDVQVVENGDTDIQRISECIDRARQNLAQPSFIRVTTTIGYGSVNQGTAKVHGAPLASDDLINVRKRFGMCDTEPFTVPSEVYEFYATRVSQNESIYDAWTKMMGVYARSHAELYEDIQRRFQLKLPSNVDELLSALVASPSKVDATRAYSSECLNVLGGIMPEIVGGSADLSDSNKCVLKGTGDLTAIDLASRAQRYVRFGIREHAMSAICNGAFAYGGMRPFCATFLNFLTYGWGAVRLSALSKFGVLYITTHDSIELGEDGPTHQPIEVLSLLRSTPNMNVFRPCNRTETAAAYKVWLSHSTTPTVISLCRSPTPLVVGTDMLKAAQYGAYVLDGHDFHDQSDDDSSRVLLAASGTEVHLCVAASEVLRKEHKCNVRVVSMPCWEIFKQQTIQYQRSILSTKKLTLHVPSDKLSETLIADVSMYVEAASTYGWGEYFDIFVGMERFGASAHKDTLMKHFGFTPENIVSKTLKFLKDKSS